MPSHRRKVDLCYWSTTGISLVDAGTSLVDKGSGKNPIVVITEQVSKRPEPTQKRNQISSATSRRSQRKDTLSEDRIWTDLLPLVPSTGILDLRLLTLTNCHW